jgi:hypothetical protein
MLGIQDPWISLVYLLCIFSTILCLAWGIWHWNESSDVDEESAEAIARWAAEEDIVEEDL